MLKSLFSWGFLHYYSHGAADNQVRRQHHAQRDEGHGDDLPGSMKKWDVNLWWFSMVIYGNLMVILMVI